MEKPVNNTKLMLLRGLAVAAIVASSAASGADSPTAGHDLKNSRCQTGDKKISPKTVGCLHMATGNNDMVPDSVLNCINGGGSPPACMSRTTTSIRSWRWT